MAIFDLGRRNFLSSAAIGAAAASFAGVSGSSAVAQMLEVGDDTAFDPRMWMDDIAIVNARVITMDPALPEAQAVLVRQGRIAFVGSSAQVRERARGARVIDAGRRALIPGFVDTHLHLEWSAIATVLMLGLYNPPPKTIQELLSRLKVRVDQTPAGKWVCAHGEDLAKGMAEKRLPTTAELDGITQAHPLVVFDDVHTCTANTLAMKAMGLLTIEDEAQAKFWSTGLPYTGGVVARDKDGAPLYEDDTVMRLPRDLYSVEDMKGAIRKVAKSMFIAGGVTTGSPLCLLSSNEYSADQQLQAMGELPMRMRAYYMAPFSVSVESVLETGMTRGFGNDMFRIGGFKLIMDGGRKDGRQIHHYTRDEFANLLTNIQNHGFQTITHCVSLEGSQLVTDAVSDVRARFPNGPLFYHRTEHFRPPLELALRQKELGIFFTMIASQNGYRSPGPWGDDGADFKSYVDAGVRPLFVSDKCGGEPIDPRPLWSIASACNEQSRGGTATPGQAIAFDDALRMWTLWAAQSTHQIHDRGTISVGKLGDFALLSGDPRAMHPEEYFKLSVAKTILGGKVVYEA